MAHSPNIPKVKDCIPYVESCGWKFSHYNRPWYVFKPVEPRADGKTEIPFTLTEIRHAMTNGW